MSFAAQSIENDAREFHSRIEGLKSSNESSGASRHPMRIDDKNDRQTKPYGHLRCASRPRLPIEAIEQAHHTFNHRHVLTCARLRKERFISLAPEHPAIESMRRHS